VKTAVTADDARYRQTVDRLLQGQAYRELGAARLFEGGLSLAPDERGRRLIAAHAAEERAHYRAVMDVWSRFGGVSAAEIEARAEERLLRHPLPSAWSWFDLGVAQFLFDRAGLWQLREYQDCSFAPYRRLVAGILRDEDQHQDFGAETIVALCGAGRPAAGDQNAVFARWLAVALRSFGRPDSEGDRYALAAGLKRRAAAVVMRDFVDDLKPTLRLTGLAFPAPQVLDAALPDGLDFTL
jgi:1,2-phenylacetyl-CoA epoxidase catalytic subunit